jgi:hypothetical protein
MFGGNADDGVNVLYAKHRRAIPLDPFRGS